MNACIVITTCSNQKEAEELASKLVETKLAACVQLSQIQSFYVWEGKACNKPEIKLLIKTRKSLYPEVETFIKANHSYEVPEIISVPIENGLSAYFDWVEVNTKDRSFLA